LISISLGILVAIAVISTQRNLAPMIAEFGLDLSLLTSISCSSLFPAGLLLMIIFSVAISLLPSCHFVANRWNAIHIVWSILAFSLYVWGMFSPLMTLFAGINN
jgi:hypothetical protein